MTQRPGKDTAKRKRSCPSVAKTFKNDSTKNEAIQCTNSLRAISTYDIPPLRPRTVHCLSTLILYRKIENNVLYRKWQGRPQTWVCGDIK